MSRLKKLILLSIVLFLIAPVIFMMYSTLLFGNILTDSQWFSTSILSVLGVFILVIVSLEMK